MRGALGSHVTAVTVVEVSIYLKNQNSIKSTSLERTSNLDLLPWKPTNTIGRRGERGEEEKAARWSDGNSCYTSDGCRVKTCRSAAVTEAGRVELEGGGGGGGGESGGGLKGGGRLTME